MNIHIISGSHRAKSQSIKVSTYISKELEKKGLYISLTDISTTILPLIESSQEPTQIEKIDIDTYIDQMASADGYIFVTPEWNGAATPGIMNALQLVEKESWFKPALIVSVSSGRGGSYPIIQLRSFGYKNNKINFIPEHIIVRNVKEVLNDKETDQSEDMYIRDRIHYALNILVEYTKCHIDLRKTLDIESIDPKYDNGM